MNELNLSAREIDFLLSPEAIRTRAAEIFKRTQGGKGFFQYHPEKMDETVQYVLSVIRKNYPTLQIPFHSRWGHFRAGGVDRKAALAQKIASFESLERVRIQLDLVITSVLLDAGAGNSWTYAEAESGQTFNRSEGLGVASFHMFMAGVMSASRKDLKADALGLQAVSVADLKKYFQVNESNPLVGCEGRVSLLNNLGRVVADKTFFRDGRPGNIVDHLMSTVGRKIPAKAVLRAVLDGFGGIWPGRIQAGGRNLGDVWKHSQLGPSGSMDSLVPFHKLSQWLTYSLIEPMIEGGLEITGVDELTGLAEYRNGGLLLDSGLISLRDPKHQLRAWEPSSDLIIEWRALTIYLLDQIGIQVQNALGVNAQTFPLAKVLEGGTWWAGRFLAREKRDGGVPPLNIISDGTVF